jgi:hypothetical protein|tara:strand:+ start:7096 stop:8478 length:1383 start_codon:yes stop_codon:yes gene_type:complete
MGFFDNFLNKKEEDKLESEENKELPAFHSTPIGSSGTENYGGYFEEEYLDALRNNERADIFDKMRRSDPQVMMCLSAVKNPIKSASAEIHAAGDDFEYKNDARLIEKILFESMATPFPRFLAESLTMIEFGFAMFEVTHKNFINQPIYDDEGNKILDSYTGIKNISWRSPKTIERWNLDHDSGELLSVDQLAFGEVGRQVTIPAKYLLLFTLNREGSNYEGISALRPCYGNWWRKNNFNKINAIGIEKFAVPTPIATIPQGRQASTQYSKLITALEKYTTHQSNYLIKPEGFDIDLRTNTYDPSKVETSIENEDKRMVKAFLANFLELGMSGSGAYALSNDLSDFFLTGLQFLANEIADQINKNLIPELVKMNFGPRDKYPTLKFSGISDKAGKELADILNVLTNAQILTPDDKLEKHLRKRLGITEMSEDGQRIKSTPVMDMSLSEKFHALKRTRRRRF